MQNLYSFSRFRAHHDDEKGGVRVFLVVGHELASIEELPTPEERVEAGLALVAAYERRLEVPQASRFAAASRPHRFKAVVGANGDYRLFRLSVTEIPRFVDLTLPEEQEDALDAVVISYRRRLRERRVEA